MNFEELGTRDNCCDKSDTAIRSKMVDCHITDKYNNNNGPRRVLYCFFLYNYCFFYTDTIAGEDIWGGR